MYTNVDGILNKRLELLTRIQDEKPDIVGITEISPKNGKTIEAPEINIRGYVIFYDLASRGMCLYIKEELNPLQVNFNLQQGVFCSIRLRGNDKLLVGCIYRSPNNSPEQNTDLNNLITAASDFKSSHMILMGDFNYPQIHWNSQVCKSSVNSDVFKFLETTRDCFLHQHVQVPTHYRSDQTPNCLDLIFTNEEEMISEITTQSPIGKSHHLVLTFEAACYVEIYPSKTIKYCYDKANYDAMKQELTNWEWRHVLGNQPIDEDCNTVENKIHEVIEKFVPRKRHFKNSHKRAEWMDADTSAKIKAKNLAYQKYLKSRSKQDYEHYTRLHNQTRWRVRQKKKQF